MGQPVASQPPEEAMRAGFYDLLATCLARPLGQDMLDHLASLKGDDKPMGAAIADLAQRAATTSPKEARREFEALFIGLGRGELMPYASVYLTGFLHEKPLALLRQDMATHLLRRADDVFEPEDNIASLCEMMAALITGRVGPSAPIAAQRNFFARHIAPWAGLFFDDLSAAKGAQLYAPIGRIGRLFMDIEAEAFRLTTEEPQR